MPLPLHILRGAGTGAFVLDFATLTPADLASRFGWTRTGAGTMQESDGDVVYGPHNLLTGSESLASTPWKYIDNAGAAAVALSSIPAPDGSLTAFELSYAVNSGKFVRDSYGAGVAATAGALSTHAVWLRAKTGTFKLKLSRTDMTTWATATCSAEITLSETWQQVTLQFTPASTGVSDFVIGAEDLNSYVLPTLGTVLAWHPQSNIGPLSDYVPTTTAPVYLMRSPDYTHGVPGLLLEGARTQLFASPADLTNPVWYRTGADLSPVLAPDGVAGAALVEDASSGFHRFFQSVPTTGTTHTITFLAQAGARDYVYLRLLDAAGTLQFAFFNIAAGAVVSVSASLTGRIVAVESGWWRCIVTAATALNGSNTVVFGASADGTSEGYSGTSGATAIRVSVRNAEPGAYPTSYIPNPGTGTVTRARDVADIGPGAEFDALWPGAQGTIVVEWVDIGRGTGFGDLFVARETTGAARKFGLYTENSVLWLFPGVGNEYINCGPFDAGARNRVAFSFGPAGIHTSLNGSAPSAFTGITSFISTDTLRFAGGALIAAEFRSLLIRFKSLRTQTTGAALQALTA